MPDSETSGSPPGVLPPAVVQALFDGLLSVIKKLNPHYAPRVNKWLKNAGEEFGYRHARDGVDAATTWLIEELRAPRLPDLRATKNLKEDSRVVNRHYELTLALKPVFRKRSISNRNLQAAPIIATVLGRRVDAGTLPKDRRLAQFLHSLLVTNAVTLSRARRRLARYDRYLLSKAGAYLELATKDTAADPSVRALAESALDVLRRETPPFVNRYKP
jgi:hypothetical protein